MPVKLPPEQPLIPLDRRCPPYGLLCFALMLPGSTWQDRCDTVDTMTGILDAEERLLGGNGLRIVHREYKAGKLEWVVEPLKKPADDRMDQATALRMAKLALYLRDIEEKCWRNQL